mgnify:CR=1 FL=1
MSKTQSMDFNDMNLFNNFNMKIIKGNEKIIIDFFHSLYPDKCYMFSAIR